MVLSYFFDVIYYYHQNLILFLKLEAVKKMRIELVIPADLKIFFKLLAKVITFYLQVSIVKFKVFGLK